MADALTAVHADDAFHGELSTESILMLPSGQAILWDMPLVIANRLTDRRGEERLMRQLMHIAPFLAPERARGEGPSRAADIYSLGAVLCAAAGARLPTDVATLATVHRVATGLWRPEVPVALPEELRRSVKQMLSTDAHARPSAQELLQRLSIPARAAAFAPARSPE